MAKRQVLSVPAPQIGQPFIPFGKFRGIYIPDAILRATTISPGAKLTYGRLARYAGRDGRCYPSVNKLAKEIGFSERQAQRYLAELEREHIIRRMPRFHGRAQTSNEFVFLWHEIFQQVAQLPEGVSDPSPHRMTDTSLKESQSEESHIKEKHNPVKADSGHVSSKSDDTLLNTNFGRPNITPIQTSTAVAVKAQFTAPELARISDRLAAFMDGERPPNNLLIWIGDLARQYELTTDNIMRTLDSAWNRNARPGRKNRPKGWSWFYEVFRNAVVPGYAARLP